MYYRCGKVRAWLNFHFLRYHLVSKLLQLHSSVHLLLLKVKQSDGSPAREERHVSEVVVHGEVLEDLVGHEFLDDSVGGGVVVAGLHDNEHALRLNVELAQQPPVHRLLFSCLALHLYQSNQRSLKESVVDSSYRRKGK